MKLWDKQNWNLNQFVEVFETKDDLLLDQKLLLFDIYGSLAHAYQLQTLGILTKKDIQDIKQGFKKIIELEKKGLFKLQMGDEDIHSKIENFLTQNYGEVGKKIHTGRSRNDQILTALRLFTKDQLLDIWISTLELSQSFVQFAKQYEHLPMPGYTHTQKAMPSSIGLWASSFAYSLLDDAKALKAAFDQVNQSPLGSAAGFNSPLALDKQLTASLMGFERVQINPIYCQNSRGKIEGLVIASLMSVMQTLNKFATDILLYTESHFDYFIVDSSICTGSSIMPQKKNVDLAELIRSKLHLVLGNYTQVVSLSSNLISGYNRDIQDTKKPLFESLETTLNCLQATSILLKSVTPKLSSLEKDMTDELFATHSVYELVSKGVAFREAYLKISEKFLRGESIKTNSKVNFDLELDRLDLDIKIYQKQVCKELNSFQSQLSKLLDEEGDLECYNIK